MQFADDIAVYIRGYNRTRNGNILEEAIRIIKNNLKELGLELEPKKTSLMEFNKSGKVDDEMSIYIEGHKIPNLQETKFLGITMDNQLNFEFETYDNSKRQNRKS